MMVFAGGSQNRFMNSEEYYIPFLLSQEYNLIQSKKLFNEIEEVATDQFQVALRSQKSSTNILIMFDNSQKSPTFNKTTPKGK